MNAEFEKALSSFAAEFLAEYEAEHPVTDIWLKALAAKHLSPFAPSEPRKTAKRIANGLHDCINWPTRFFDEDEARRIIQSAIDSETAGLRAEKQQLLLNLTLMHFAGLKVRSCWYSPNVLDPNYAAGAIARSATCDCQPCKDWRDAEARKALENL